MSHALALALAAWAANGAAAPAEAVERDGALPHTVSLSLPLVPLTAYQLGVERVEAVVEAMALNGVGRRPDARERWWGVEDLALVPVLEAEVPAAAGDAGVAGQIAVVAEGRPIGSLSTAPGVHRLPLVAEGENAAARLVTAADGARLVSHVELWADDAATTPLAAAAGVTLRLAFDAQAAGASWARALGLVVSLRAKLRRAASDVAGVRAWAEGAAASGLPVEQVVADALERGASRQPRATALSAASLSTLGDASLAVPLRWLTPELARQTLARQERHGRLAFFALPLLRQALAAAWALDCAAWPGLPAGLERGARIALYVLEEEARLLAEELGAEATAIFAHEAMTFWEVAFAT